MRQSLHILHAKSVCTLTEYVKVGLGEGRALVFEIQSVQCLEFNLGP